MSFSDFGWPQIDTCMDIYYKKSAHMNVFKANKTHHTWRFSLCLLNTKSFYHGLINLILFYQEADFKKN